MRQSVYNGHNKQKAIQALKAMDAEFGEGCFILIESPPKHPSHKLLTFEVVSQRVLTAEEGKRAASKILGLTDGGQHL